MVHSTEVRRCRRCEASAVVLVSDWKHSVFGAATGSSTRDYRCQACGARFTIHPRGKLIGLWIAGVLTLPIFIGVVLLAIAWRRSRADGANPVVPDAPVPQIRYRDGPPLRTCASCGGTAAAAKITRRTHNGVPTGTEYVYECSQCKRGFTIESLWGHTLSLFGSGLLLGGGLFVLATVESPLSRFGWGAALSFFGLVLLAQLVKRLRNRIANTAKPDLLL